MFQLFPTTFCSCLKVSSLILKSLIHFELIFVQDEKHEPSFSFLHADVQFPSNICWKGCLFSIVYFWCLCQKSGEHSRVDSYLHLLFCSIGLHVCFYANTMLLLLLCLCNIVWSQELWYLQHCSFCLVLPWLFEVFCVSIWALGLFFQSL
jgi:hypothetical protein